MGIDRCFEHGAVVPELASADKFDAIRELIRRAPIFREIEDLDEFEQTVMERETLQTTGLGHGVAIAHGRTAVVDRVLIGLGLSRTGISYDSPDGKPVHLLFVIASPPHLSLDYLQALSTLVRCLREQPVREAILESIDEREIESRLREAFALSLGRQACGAAGSH